MALPLFLGAGAGAGALVGAAAGFFLHKQKKTKPKTAEKVPALEGAGSKSAVSAVPAVKSSSKAAPREIFGVQVKYLTTSNEFYTTLARFETYLQFKAERQTFKTVVEHIDNLLGMDALLHGRTPVAKAALPNLAETARRKVMHALNDIIDFSNEERPSPTKKENMTTIKEEINEALLAIVKDMNRALAAQPIVIKK